MRRTPLLIALAACLLIASTACTQQVTGTARPDPVTTPVTLVKDGYGIKLGFDDAPVQLELYTEPQCNHCADLQADFGDQLLSYINLGQLALTYRPVTFLDAGANQHSERVANAMFAAVTKPGDPAATTAGEFQHLVEAMWKVYGAGPDHPTNKELADMARTAGIPDAQVAKIAGGESAVDLKDLEDNNFEFLYEIDDISTGTPTVYDLKKDQKLDIYDDAWLSKVMGS